MLSLSYGAICRSDLRSPNSAYRAPSVPNTYVGFRVREEFDADISDAFASRTSIYTWNGSGYSDSFETYWQGTLATGQSLYMPSSGLTFRQLSVTSDGGSAVVSICRSTTTVETGALCHNGLDDDCDGLVDDDDPGCGAAAATPDAPIQANPVGAPISSESVSALILGSFLKSWIKVQFPVLNLKDKL